MKTIKYILILIAGICLTNIKGLAQSNNVGTAETSQPTTSDSAKINKPAVQVNQFQEESNRIKNNVDTEENIGILKLSADGPVAIYSNGKKTGRTVIIDHVYLNIQDGYIIQIQAFAGGKQFMNMQSPIAINSRRFSKQDFLQCLNSDNESVVMEEFLQYTSLKPFAPNDNTIWLKTPPDKDTSNTVTLKKGVSINSVLDLRLYTDALGLFNATPNAIVETDVRFKQVFKTGIVRKSGLSVFHYFKLNFNASKFDSKNNVEPVDSNGVFSRTGLLQKSYINGELAINLLQDWTAKNSVSFGYLDAGGGINIGNIARADTVSKTIDTVAVTTRNIFAELGVNLKTSSNIGCNIYLREMVDFSPQTKFYNENPVWFTKIGGEVYFNPFGNPASRIFGRMNYVFSTNWSEHQNHFFQFQFGYSVLLSSLINK